MALTNANVTPNSVSTDASGNREYIYGQIVFSGSYPSGGELFDVSQFFQDKSAPKAVVSMTFGGANGYSYGYVPAALLANCKIKISTGSNTELGAGAYPGGVTGDTVYFAIILKKA